MKTVQLYSADWCVYCQSLKSFLNSKNIAFTEINVDIPENREEMMRISGGNQTIPMVVYDGTIEVNPSPKRVIEMIGGIDG